MKYVGTTETYDPAFVSDLSDKLVHDANIIITKRLTDELIKVLYQNRSRCILHLTVTGNGGTILEPNVPTTDWTLSQVKKLLEYQSATQTSIDLQGFEDEVRRLTEKYQQDIIDITFTTDNKITDIQNYLKDLESLYNSQVEELNGTGTEVGVAEGPDTPLIDQELELELKRLEDEYISKKTAKEYEINQLQLDKDATINEWTVQYNNKITELQESINSTAENVSVPGNFLPTQIVFRIDPIVPFRQEYINNLLTLLDQIKLLSKQYKCTFRVRVSMIDMYPHVVHRFRVLKEPFIDQWTQPQELFDYISKLLKPYTNNLVFESCAEVRFDPSVVKKVGCVSETDLLILGLDPSEYGLPSTKQRPGCLCLAKKQILGVKPSRCPHQCLYCYWKDDLKTE